MALSGPCRLQPHFRLTLHFFVAAPYSASGRGDRREPRSGLRETGSGFAKRQATCLAHLS